LLDVLNIETATNELSDMCLAAVEHVITNKMYDRFKIPTYMIPLIEQSWEDEHISIYGRFDLVFDGYNIKMLEYNADTPTSLFEAAVFQWNWKEEMFPNSDQFNSIHEKILQHFTDCKPFIKNELHFTCCTELPEDLITVEYLRDCAHQVGIKTKLLDINEIGVDNSGTSKFFIGLEDENIENIFKLYPWEWMVNEEFGKMIPQFQTIWSEPAWKMILSNKMLLVILWELFPYNKYLLPTFESPKQLPYGNYVQKPLLSREGANVSIHEQNGRIIEEVSGEYGEEGYIYQQYVDIAKHDNKVPIIGSWVINHTSAGIGIRESETLITGNLSNFVPHIME
jgi:glutathionylspermidine synthase